MCMSFPERKMSLEHQLPVVMKKTQMNGDRGGSQCGLTSLLPMSCRGRAAAFARDLHSRLRNLGTAHDGECESTWLTRENNHRPAPSNVKEHETFYDFEVECGSPSSPVEEIEITFPEKSTEDTDLPFYDVDSDLEVKETPKLLLKEPDRGKNGFTFSTAFYTPESPVKQQPTKENGLSDKPLYAPITFEGCARQSSCDEVDFPRSPILFNQDRLILPTNYSIVLDSDSEFDSAKSNPSESIEDVSICESKEDIDLPVAVENLTVNGCESTNGETYPTDCVIENREDKNKVEDITQNDTKIVTSDLSEKKEPSPAPEIDATLLSTETNKDDKEDEAEGEDDRPQRVRRCSSLKTGKTPPGTPGRKKIVRFADVLGLDLADVKTFMDEIPVIPKSAYDDLAGCDVQNSPPARPTPRYGALTLVPLFQLPRDVTEKLERYNVCLESSRVCDGVHVTICGSVRVRNLDFHKTVHVRYTMNRWRTFTDLQATYVQGSCDGYSDRFQFVLYAPCISSGQRLEIAVRFQCKGQQFWDNNCGANYCFDCLALGSAPTTGSLTSAPAALHPTVDWHPSFY
ncbi:glycogen-binding subunit 76A isoform X2 [Aricia agestis]|uniref:glycogen-binding subunit 76A isoform X2 n=1 Tax=Aricia agestis TaxID=91739 RepID=UPI001C20311A|nr:glycogen-binding subunit 76A isoform X2 [Aricia agestis]